MITFCYCDSCGAVYNKDVINWPGCGWTDKYCIDPKSAMWNPELEENCLYVNCPTCKIGTIFGDPIE